MSGAEATPLAVEANTEETPNGIDALPTKKQRTSENDDSPESSPSASDDDPPDSSSDVPAPHGRSHGKRRRMVELASGRVVNANKVRNHVNPLSAPHNRPVGVPPVVLSGGWAAVFRDPTQPLVLDLGCAKGHYCLEGARRWPAVNWVGLEIREPLVVRANLWRTKHALSNLYYVHGNASAGIGEFLVSLPPGALRRVCIQCPDPCFKKRHQKRRMVTRALVDELRTHMPVGSVLFLQSDVEMVAQQMADTVAIAGGFAKTTYSEMEVGAPNPDPSTAPHGQRVRTPGNAYNDAKVGTGDWEGKGAAASSDGEYDWLPANPYGFPSEREACVLARGLPMFRMLFARTATDGPPTPP